MLRDFNPAQGRDIVFIPVGINYDRTLEDRTLLLDLEPRPPARSPGQALLKTARFVGRNLKLLSLGRWYRFGYACVNLGTPISAREYWRSRGVDPRTLSREERLEPMNAFAEHLMEAVGRVIPALPASLVSTLFLRRPGGALSELEIKAECQKLIDQLEAAGARVYVPRKDRDYAITVGLRMLTLRRLILEEGGLFRAAPNEAAVLAYYAHSIAHLLPPPSATAPSATPPSGAGSGS
jgi:glycerol-3-phosphate O-acyltransferase